LENVDLVSMASKFALTSQIRQNLFGDFWTLALNVNNLLRLHLFKVYSVPSASGLSTSAQVQTVFQANGVIPSRDLAIGAGFYGRTPLLTPTHLICLLQ
jgi:ABC-type multidrug transport system permease subunit